MQITKHNIDNTSQHAIPFAPPEYSLQQRAPIHEFQIDHKRPSNFQFSATISLFISVLTQPCSI
jgi:hypothetical protein